MKWKDFDKWHLSNKEIGDLLGTKPANVSAARVKYAPQTARKMNVREKWENFSDWHLSNQEIADLLNVSYFSVANARARYDKDAIKRKGYAPRTERTQITLNFDNSIYEKISKKADAENKTFNAIVEEILKDAL